MKKTSAGILLFRIRERRLEVLLVHAGGPYWSKKDRGAWFVPKGEVETEEDLLVAARREFTEETTLAAQGELVPLGSVAHKSGKIVHAWAFQGDCDPMSVRSNTFKMEWPPRSGLIGEFPEVDRADFFDVANARNKMHRDEFELVERLDTWCRAKGLVAADEPTAAGAVKGDIARTPST